MQITVQYFLWKVPCLIRTLIFEGKFEGGGGEERIKLLILYTGKYGYYNWKKTQIFNLFFPLLKKHTDYQL